jgi:hypothetical protein
MKIYLLREIEFDGQTYPAGVQDVAIDVANALFARGPARPATVDEVEKAGASSVEAASNPPETSQPDVVAARENAAATPEAQTGAPARTPVRKGRKY